MNDTLKQIVVTFLIWTAIALGFCATIVLMIKYVVK